MSCENVQERISLLFDDQLSPEGRENVLAHTRVCRECGTHLESLQTQRALLRKMAQMPVPDALATSLRVMASHERERQLVRISMRERMRRLVAKVDLAFDNLMRPVALPLTGGLAFHVVAFRFDDAESEFLASSQRPRFLHRSPGQHRNQPVE